MDGGPATTPSGGGRVWRLAVRNESSAVGRANGSLERFLKSSSVDPEAAFPVLLALEEVVTNIIKYGYDDDGEHEILMEARVLPGEIVLEVTDDGREFDPLRAPPPDLEGPIEDRPIGGLGVHLLRNLAQRLAYQRVRGKNVLSVCFQMKRGNQESDTGGPHVPSN